MRNFDVWCPAHNRMYLSFQSCHECDKEMYPEGWLRRALYGEQPVVRVADMTDRVVTYEAAQEMLEEAYTALRLLLDSKEVFSEERDFRRSYVRSAAGHVKQAIQDMKEAK